MSLLRIHGAQPAIALMLAIAIPFAGCQTVQVSEEASPGTVGSVKVHIHNGHFDEDPLPGYTVQLTRPNAVNPITSNVSLAREPVWFRAMEPGLYQLKVQFETRDVHEQMVTVSSHRIASIRIESQAHNAIHINGSSHSSFPKGAGEVTTDLLKGVGIAIASVVAVGVIVGAATIDIWLPIVIKHNKD